MRSFVSYKEMTSAAISYRRGTAIAVIAFLLTSMAGLPLTGAPLTDSTQYADPGALEEADTPVLTRSPAQTGDMMLHLHTGSFDPVEEYCGEHQLSETAGLYIVQFANLITAADKSALEDMGVWLLEYLPSNAFSVYMGPAAARLLSMTQGIRWVGQFPEGARVAPWVEEGLTAQEDTPLGGSGTGTLRICIYDEGSGWSGMYGTGGETAGPLADEAGELALARGQVRAIAEGFGGDIIGGWGGGLLVAFEREVLNDGGLFEALEGSPFVQWVEPAPVFTLHNDVADGVIGVTNVRANHSLEGHGQIVAVADTGIDTGVDDWGTSDDIHEDFDNRVKNITAWERPGNATDTHGHGTHVSGSVLGNGNASSGSIRGMAPNASLVFQSIEDSAGWLLLNVSDIKDLFWQAYNESARVHTNSWGASYAGWYTTDSRAVDQFMWDHPDFLILFSAGNDGVDDDDDGVVDEDSMGSPATAKNCVTVGASENWRPSKTATYGGSWPLDFSTTPISTDKLADDTTGLAAFSSRGPTDDGRIKPDIVAPGTYILSSKSSLGTGGDWGSYNTKYHYMGGTSMATPITAGAAALVRQHYTDEELITPSAALVKATMLNGADDITPGQYGTGADQELQNRSDFSQGWGRLDVTDSLHPAGGRSKMYWDETTGLNAGAGNEFQFTVGSSAENLTVSLVWTDYPAAAWSSVNLVNDLNLKVTGPTASTSAATGPMDAPLAPTVYNGNDFSAPFNNNVDHVNNVEMVFIPGPGTGSYTINVTGATVPNGPQPYAIVVTGAISGDTEKPEFGTDNSDGAGTTGGQAALNITVTDNINVAEVSAEFWFGSGTHYNWSMNGSDDNYTLTVDVPVGSADDLHYLFHAGDTSGLWNSSAQGRVTVTDDDAPAFGADGTPAGGTTGDGLTFQTAVTDNIAVHTVTVEYWFGTGTHYNWSMNGTGPYTQLITVPSGSTDMLHYVFHANDTVGVWAHSPEEDIPVTDNDPPALGADGTPAAATTGDPLTFETSPSDNIGVANVTVEYWFGGGSHTNASMTPGGTYNHGIAIPSNSTAGLHYFFSANDSADNWEDGGQGDITITDDDPPFFSTNTTPTSGGTGKQLTFRVAVYDNMAVHTVSVEYWYGGGGHTNVTMDGSGPYTKTIVLGSDPEEDLHYIFRANDTTGVWNQSAESLIDIFDSGGPRFGADSTPTSADTGETITFQIEVTDDLGVSTVAVEWWYEGNATHHNWTMNGTGPYTQELTLPVGNTTDVHYIFHAGNASGGWNATDEAAVVVADAEPPAFGANGTPAAGTTGDPLTFMVAVFDNVEVDEVWVEYWFGSGTRYNWSMNGTGTYTQAIHVPADSADDLHYVFRANDTAGMWNATVQADVIITDDDAPEFGSDGTPGTGATGGQVGFNIALSDNVGVSGVTVEYWFGAGTHYNWSMNGTGPYTLDLDVPADSADNLHYIFHAGDSAGNWNETATGTVVISDGDDPAFGADSTPSAAGTGNIITFHISVTDGVGVHTVTVEHWLGSGKHHLWTMNGTGPYTQALTLPANSTDDLHYIFHANDSAGNTADTTQADVTVTDDDKPYFGPDLSPGSGLPGADLTFRITAFDNIAVTQVKVEYWFDAGGHTNVTMDGTGPYTKTISLPAGSAYALNYFFYAGDGAGNFQVMQGAVIDVDGEKPAFGADTTPAAGTTGDSFTFRIAVTDNVAVHTVTVEHWFGAGTHTNVTLAESLPPSTTIVIPADFTGTLHYIFHANDTAGNWNETSTEDIPITDNDRPVFGIDTTPGTGTTGDDLTLNITVTDNIGVVNVTAEHWFGSGSPSNVTMEGAGPYTLVLKMPNKSLKTLHYRIWARDAAGMHNNTTVKDVAVEDNDPPALGADNSPSEGATGDPFALSVDASDNIGIFAVRVQYWFGNGTIWYNTLAGDGSYTLDLPVPPDLLLTLHYRIFAEDTAGLITWGDTVDVPILDDDAPSLMGDHSDDEATTGDNFTFQADFADNIAVTNLTLEYWFGSKVHRNITLNATLQPPWDIVVPLRSTKTLYYRFWADDAGGNLAGTAVVAVMVVDNDAPELTGDNTPQQGTGGSNITISAVLEDNIGVVNVSVVYWFDWGEHQNATLLFGRGTYSLVLDLPEDALFLRYHFRAKDGAGNWLMTSEVLVSIVSAYSSLFGQDSTAAEGTTGDAFAFVISVEDIAVAVSVEYWFGGAEHINLTISTRAGYSYPITLPANSTAPMYYRFHAADGDGRWEATVVKEVTMVDNDPPFAYAGEGDHILWGGTATFDGSASTDNVGIVNYTWNFFDGEIYVTLHGAEASHRFMYAGVFNVSLLVRDGGGNTQFDIVTVVVVDESDPHDGMVEVEMGPFTDTDGNPLEDARVTVVFDGEEYNGTTDESGFVTIEIPDDALGTTLDVDFEKEGFEGGSFRPVLDENGTVTATPPELKESSPETGTNWLPFLILAVIIVIAVTLILVLIRKKTESEGPDHVRPDRGMDEWEDFGPRGPPGKPPGEEVEWLAEPGAVAHPAGRGMKRVKGNGAGKEKAKGKGAGKGKARGKGVRKGTARGKGTGNGKRKDAQKGQRAEKGAPDAEGSRDIPEDAGTDAPDVEWE